jgi:alpha-L-fucosidase 2
MLLHSYHGEMHFLPALPDLWPTGRASGLRARGGFTVDLEWREGILVQAAIHAAAAKTCVIAHADGPYDLSEASGRAVTVRRMGHRIAFDCEPGVTYHWTRRPEPGPVV